MSDLTNSILEAFIRDWNANKERPQIACVDLGNGDRGAVCFAHQAGAKFDQIVIDDIVDVPIHLHRQILMRQYLRRDRRHRKTWRGRTFVYWVDDCDAYDSRGLGNEDV